MNDTVFPFMVVHKVSFKNKFVLKGSRSKEKLRVNNSTGGAQIW